MKSLLLLGLMSVGLLSNSAWARCCSEELGPPCYPMCVIENGDLWLVEGL